MLFFIFTETAVIPPPNKKPKLDKCPHGLTSKTAKALAYILGETAEVIQLDRAKQQCPNSSYFKEKYDSLLTSLQTQVLAKHTEMCTQLENWEKQLRVEKGVIPTVNDFRDNPETSSLLKKKNYACKLLQSWRITVHL